LQFFFVKVLTDIGKELFTDFVCGAVEAETLYFVKKGLGIVLYCA